MIAVIQRCIRANVKISQNIVGQIGNGLVIFLGVTKDDNEDDADFLVRKVSGLRIYNDSNDKMNFDVWRAYSRTTPSKQKFKGKTLYLISTST